jgi:hypothetical protein
MLAVVKPSPLRLWGFLLTVVGGALVAFGSIGTWAAVTLGGTTVGAVPTKGIDLWQGKLTLALGALMVVGILALRFVAPRRRSAVAIAIVMAAAAALAVAVWCAVDLSSVVHDTGVDQLIAQIASQLHLSVADVTRQVTAVLAREGIDVKPQFGLWMTAAGGAIALAGGVVDLAWVRQERVVGNAIDTDTLPMPEDGTDAETPP